ncbi:MAG: hypothetical protein ACXAEF_14970, partial [Candidatus Thorarchaeota archaeon]
MQRKLFSMLFLCVLMLTMLNSASIPISTDEQMEISEAINLDETLVVSTDNYPEPMDISGNTYTDHLRITITSNSEFLAQKSSESWDGS